MLLVRRSRIRFNRFDACTFFLGTLFGFYLITWVALINKQLPSGSCVSYNHHIPTKTSETLNFQQPDNNFLLVAVMTARIYLDTRAASLYNTWGKNIPGGIVFFVGGSEPYHGDLPVIVLKDVDELTYPPQKKCFRMIQYITTHFLYDFEWFMRADDDVFVKPDRLEAFLKTIDSTKALYLGQPGMGVKEESGKLGLDDAPYCMGGPGVFFTRSTLERMKFHIDDCIASPATLHEDTELGRCVYLHAGVSCSNAYEFSRLFMMNYKNKSGSFTHKLGEPEERAITLHPVKQSPHMYRLDNHFSNVRLENLRSKIETISNDVAQYDDIIGNTSKVQLSDEEATRLKLSQMNGWISEENDISISSQDMPDPEWEFINRKHIYSRHNMHQHPKAGIAPSLKAAAQTTAANAVKRVSSLNKKGMKPSQLGYQRLSHNRVMENIVIQECYRNSTISIRTRQEFHSAEIEFTDLELPDTLWMVLPLYQRSAIYSTFLSNLTKATKDFKAKINLIVVLYADDELEYKTIQQNTYNMRRSQARIYIDLITFYNEPFSRAKAITAGIEGLYDDSLIVIMDVDMIFTVKYLDRVIRNTILGKQAWFPVYFSQFHPESVCFQEEGKCDLINYTDFNVASRFGFWRYFSYGIVSVFKADFNLVHGFALDIKGWGMEDVDFFEKILKSHVTAFRSPDPALMHVYHLRICDPQLPETQYVMCETSRNKMYGYDKTMYDMAAKLNLLATQQNTLSQFPYRT